MRKTIALILLVVLAAGSVMAQSRRAPRRERIDRSRYESSRNQDVADIRLRNAGTLERELGPEMEKQVRLLIVDGYLNDRDLNYIKKLCNRSRVYGSDGKEVSNYIDIDMSRARINNGGSFFTSNRDVLNSSMFSNCSHLRSIVLPDRLRKVDRGAFRNCNNLEDVVLPASLDELGEEAFSGCTDLINVFLPDGIRTVGNKAFSGCSRLRRIYIPESVYTIGDYAFENTALFDIYLPDRLEYLGAGALSGTSIRSLYIPRDTRIGDNYLGTLSQCTDIQVDPGNRYYTMVNGALYDYNRTVLLRVLNSFAGYLNIEPDVESIANYACNGCNNITGVTIPYRCTKIGRYSFSGCSKMNEVHFESTNVSFGAGAFKNSGIVSIELPMGTTVIADEMFRNCGQLCHVEIPSGTQSLGEDAFRDCRALTTVEIPGSVNTIAKSVFESCSNLNNVILHDGIRSIGEYAFKKCNIGSINIPGSVTTIGKNAFNNNKMASITLNEGLQNIGDNAFSDNNLVELTIPTTVNHIGKKITDKNKQMGRIVCKATVPPVLDKETNSKVPLIVPASAVEAYKAQKNWKDYKNIEGQ